MNQKQRMMKTKAVLFLLAVLFGTMSAFAQRDSYNPNNYFWDEGCWGTINIEVGETKTISCASHIPNPSQLTFYTWEEWLSAGHINIVSQSTTSCTIEGITSGSGYQLWYLFEFGDNSYPYNTHKAYYLVNVTSKGKLNLSASPAGGKVVKGTKVYLTADQPDADIYYAINDWPATNGTKYTSDGITIDGSCTLRAFAKKKGYDNSELMSWTFTIEDGIEINATNFPDANFRNYLLAQDYGKDGFITNAEMVNITNISVQYKNISSLKGIEHFTALTELSCYNNQLTTLDVSKNTALLYLSCSSNQLTTLDVSKNSALTELSCHNNQLTTLDVSKNSALTELRCYENQLTALDVSKNTALTYLDCSDNQLTSLDVSKNSALTELRCYENQLTALDVSKNTALTYLDCSDNQLTSLDVSKNTALIYLACSSNQFTVLDISKNTALERLYCYENQLTALDVSKNTALIYLSCGSNQFTALDVSKNTALTSFACYNNRLTSLDVSQNTALITLNCFRNQIKGKSLDVLIGSLPQNKSNSVNNLRVYDDTENDEGNICTQKQVAAIKAKGWTPLYRNGSEWLEYEGSEDNSEEPDDPVTPDNPTAPVSIALPDIETVNVNSTIQLTPTLEPADAVTELTWASDDETIAKVTSTGRVAGIKAGTAIISVRTSNGLTAECFVIVQDTSGIVDVKTGGNDDASVYNLSGQKVTNPVKGGIYIIGGKKVIVK